MLLLSLAGPLAAQKAPDPEVGYAYPPGGQRGTDVVVQLAGYDWTPDTEFFVHDSRVQLRIEGPLSRHLLPEPPLSIGIKAYHPHPLPREVAARFVLPADLPPGPIRWQVANANGTSGTGVFFVGDGPETLEERRGSEPQVLASLPTTVNGRLARNEEVDRYVIEAPADGAITCELFARRLGSNFKGVLEVLTAEDRPISDAVDTQGSDVALTFAARAGQRYTLTLRDLNFRGDRSSVYRLAIAPAAASSPGVRKAADEITPLTLPASVAGVLDRSAPRARYRLTGTGGEVWSLSVDALRIGSPLDVSLTILGPDGKELAANDDLPGTTDSGLEFTVPAAGDYELVVSDLSAARPSPQNVYRLQVKAAEPDFALQAPQRMNVAIGEKAELVVKAVRSGGFKGPIALSFSGLPEGIVAPAEAVIVADQAELKVPLQSASDSPSGASLATITGTAKIAEQIVTRPALAQAAGNLAPRSPDENLVPRLLIASTMKPVARIRPIETDERTIHRGTFHLAELAIERVPGFNAEVIVQMDSRQPVKFRQGLYGPDVLVPPSADRVWYPCQVPDHCETNDAYRIMLVAVAQAADPRGRVRSLVAKMQADDASVAVTAEGALLKISPIVAELQARPGETIAVPVKVSRSGKLREPVRLEVRASGALTGRIAAQPLLVPVEQQEVQAPLRLSEGAPAGRHLITLRAMALQPANVPTLSETANATPMDPEILAILKSGFLPIIAETTVLLEIAKSSDTITSPWP